MMTPQFGNYADVQVQKNHNYKLIVEIRKGHDLPDKKLIGNHAVYIAIDVNDKTERTKTVNDICNPVWNEIFCFELDKIPEQIELRVRDDRMLLPNLNLGHCIINLKNKLSNYNNHPQPSIVIENGEIPLLDVLEGKLDVKIVFENANANADANINIVNSNIISSSFDSTTLPLQSKIEGPFDEVNKADFEKLPEALHETIEVFDDKKDEHTINDNNEIHKLPTLYVQEQPIIIEKEIEYIKPIEVHQTIIHRIKPTIIEQPVIIEKHEHYRAPTETIRQEEKIVKEIVNDANINNLDQKAIEDLKLRRKAEFNDKTPIIQYEKEQIRLDTNIEQKPTEIREKEVIYEQPIEIERKEIEHIKEKVVEDIKLKKEHIHQKIEPEIRTQNVEVINTGDRFYAQDAQDVQDSTLTTSVATSFKNENNNNINDEQRIEKEII